jgi:ectoine hydroxylase-related dioxygenase (phytanoyl-CoA dioxygenase family)
MFDTSALPVHGIDVERYRRDGFLIVRDVFSHSEVEAMAAEAVRLLQRRDLIDTNNIRCRWQDDVVSGECRFDCFDPVIDLSALFEGVARDSRLLAVMSALYGEPACLFKDKLIFKPANAKGYSLHQDYIAWPSFPKSFTTVIVAIDPSDAGSGGTEVFPGQHVHGNLTPPDGNYHELPEFLVAGMPGIVLELSAGDIAVFDGYMPHRSAANRSGRSRRLLYLSYNAASDGGEQRDAHYAEFKTWLQEQYAKYGRTGTFFR